MSQVTKIIDYLRDRNMFHKGNNNFYLREETPRSEIYSQIEETKAWFKESFDIDSEISSDDNGIYLTNDECVLNFEFSKICCFEVEQGVQYALNLIALNPGKKEGALKQIIKISSNKPRKYSDTAIVEEIEKQGKRFRIGENSSEKAREYFSEAVKTGLIIADIGDGINLDMDEWNWYLFSKDK